MPHKGFIVTTLVTLFIATPGGATEKSETRTVRLKTGELIEVPLDAVLVPGLPIVVPGSELTRIESARMQLEKNGFLESPESKSLAYRHKEYARSQLTSPENSNVFLAKDFDFGDSGAGKIDNGLLTPESESYVTVEQSALLRTYTDTNIGNIYVREMSNTEVGVIGGVAGPTLEVAGFSGYVTKVRYRDGDLATLIMMPVDKEQAKFIEISGPTATTTELDSEVLDFLTVLLTKFER